MNKDAILAAKNPVVWHFYVVDKKIQPDVLTELVARGITHVIH